ncbi:hypothetical protein FRC12_012989 [Ceratobasidium sp. 428]|nr:hypothetical protein FRC12_012989 [Ceratobasidium sp. 428]
MDEARDFPLPPVEVVERAFPGTFTCNICLRDELGLGSLMTPASCGHIFCRECVVSSARRQAGRLPACFTCGTAGSWATAQRTPRIQPANNQQAEYDEVKTRVDELRRKIAQAGSQIERLRAEKKAMAEEELQLTSALTDHVDRHPVRGERYREAAAPGQASSSRK